MSRDKQPARSFIPMILPRRFLSKKTLNTSSFSDEIYTYDANGCLVGKLTTNPYNKIEYVYTNNSMHGKPEKMEQYENDKLSSTTTYFYQ